MGKFINVSKFLFGICYIGRISAMIDYFRGIWESLPPWVWSKIMIISGLLIIFFSLNYWAASARRKRNK